jgi:conjugal transfer pilus assembly protein TrbC
VDGIQEAGLLCFLKPFSETRMMPIMILVLIVLCAGDNFAADKDLTMPDINLVLEQSEKTSLKMKIPDNQYDQLGKDAAEELTSQFQSPEYQGEICQEQQRLRQEVFKDVLARVAPNEPESRQNTISEHDKIYLFISSSVPIATLRNYAAMINHARAAQVVMVLRGFVGGMKKIMPTMNFIGEILKKDQDCDFTQEKCESYQANIQIDPMLFQRFAIEEVPALVFLPDQQTEPLIIHGDAGLDYLLERINREAKNTNLDNLIAALRGGSGNGERDAE